MKVVLSPFHLSSLEEYAVRLRISTDELIAKIFEQAQDPLQRSILAMFGQEKKETAAPRKKTIEDYVAYTTDTVTREVRDALDVLQEVIPELGVPSPRMRQPEIVEQLFDDLPRAVSEVELNVVTSYGRSTTVSQASFGPGKCSFYYDFQLIEAIKQTVLHLFHFTFDTTSEPARSRAEAETRSLVNSYPQSRWGVASFLVGQAEGCSPEFDPQPGEILDAGRNASAAFKFLLFHEIAHHLIKHGRGLDGLDVLAEETACDEFASVIFGLALRDSRIDWVEACFGLLALYFVQHMKEVYSRQDVDLAKSYPSARERLAYIPSLWGEVYEASVVSFPFARMWGVLESAFHDYASLCRMLHMGFKEDTSIVFTGRYFCAAIMGNEISIFPNDVTAEEFLERHRRES